MIKAKIEESYKKMQGAIDAMQNEFVGLKAGRAHPDLAYNVKINLKDEGIMPLRNIATVVVKDIRTLAVTPFDASHLNYISKSIQEANLGLGIGGSGDSIHLTIPAPTEESRQKLKDVIKKLNENAKISIRNIRQTIMDHLKHEKDKTKTISEDEYHRALKDVEKKVKDYCSTVDDLCIVKEKAVMTL